MESSPTLPVAERFVSINGEGRAAGKLSTFIRFAGCNLACSYCDTAWANEPDCDVDCMSVAELVGFAVQSKTGCVTLTGGEPLAQPLALDVVRALLDVPEEQPINIEIETNGAVDIGPIVHMRADLPDDIARRLTLTVDYKLSSSGMEDRMLLDNYGMLAPWDTVKFVVGTLDDLENMLSVYRSLGLAGRCEVYISPVFGSLEPADIVDFMRANTMNRATLQLQLHKIIWPDESKGV